MQFSFSLPTEILFGRDVVNTHAERLRLGKRAFLVTGAHSGRASGALEDVERALSGLGIAYASYEGVSNNPNVVECKAIGAKARALGADFVVGIGGGSPLDAAKAIAVFARNDIEPESVFQYGYPGGVLPIVAVPTTSGTGSEVTPKAVMTTDVRQTKVSFGGRMTYPRIAMLDPTYTQSLSASVTRGTAMDAFTHCFEAFVACKAQPASDAFALEGIRRFAACMPALAAGDFDRIREELMLVSLLGGMAISAAGTTLMHAMGYPITYHYDIPHGVANCLVMPAYITALRAHRPERLDAVLAALQMTDDALIAYARTMFSPEIHPEDDELHAWAEQVVALKKPSATTGLPDDAQYVYELFADSF